MKLPSRAASDRATTSRKNGRFFDPTRRIRIASMLLLVLSLSLPRASIVELSPHGPQHPEGAAALLLATPAGHAEGFEHLAHLDELLQQAVHLFDARPAALRDPFPPAAIDHLVIAALDLRHRRDNRLDSAKLLFVRLVLRELLDVAHPWDHPDDAFKRTHL